MKKKIPEENKSKLSEEAMILQEYLGRYYRSICRRNQLEARLRGICEEMKHPIGGMNYSPVNARPTNEIGLGAAAFVFRKSEYEARIQKQKDEAAKDVLKVMDILDFLEPTSDERMVLELRYIDNLKWPEVVKRAHMSRSTCFNKHNAGLEKLLSFKKVRKVLEEYTAERDGVKK